MPRTIVVLPTPGPPVITATLAQSAVFTAAVCWRASAIPASPSYQARARGRSISTAGAGAASRRWRPAASARLGAVQARLVDRGLARVVGHRGVDRDLARAREPVDGRVRRLLGQIEQRRRLLHQARARQVDVAAARLLVEHVADARLGPGRRVARHAERGGQPVGRQEADSPDVEGEPVGVLAHARDRRRAVTLVDARRERGRDAVALQEDHHLAHLTLGVPGGMDRARPHLPDAGDLADARRIAVEDLQRLDAEALDDPPGELGADPLDEAGAEIAPEAVYRLRGHLGVAQDAELIAEPGGGLETPRHAQHRPRRHADQAADHGDDLVATVEPQARDRERAVAARVDDALDGPLQRLLGRVGAGPRARAAAPRAAAPIEQVHAVMGARPDAPFNVLT